MNKNRFRRDDRAEAGNQAQFDGENENVQIDDSTPEVQDENIEKEPDEAPGAEENELDVLTAKLNEANEALAKEKNEYLFLMAEFDNFRKRTVREKGEIIKNAAEKVFAGMLPIVDDFERGIEANRNTDGSESLKQGMELIYNKLVRFLGQNGVKPIESTGADFNPDIHEAIAMVPAADDSVRGKVIDTPTKGYTINDKVLRHAKVVVAQ